VQAATTKSLDSLDLGGAAKVSQSEVAGLGACEKPLLKGCLVKKNWYGNKQLREFHLMSSGEIKYFAVQGDKLSLKGSLYLGPKAKVTKTDHMTLNIFCHEKQRPYILMQPDSSKVNYNV